MSKLTTEEFWAEAQRSRKYVEKLAASAFHLSPADAEDLISDAIVQAAQFEQKEGSSGFKGDVKFTTYLTKIASRVYFNKHRTKKAKLVVHSFDQDDNLAHKITMPPVQHELVVASVMNKKVRAAIATLPPRYRLALQLQLKDHTPAEIAKILHIKNKAFKFTKFRALASFRQQHPELRHLLPGRKYDSKKNMDAQPKTGC